MPAGDEGHVHEALIRTCDPPRGQWFSNRYQVSEGMSVLLIDESLALTDSQRARDRCVPMAACRP
jgi:hypothetical protein